MFIFRPKKGNNKKKRYKVCGLHSSIGFQLISASF
nr:hypothetical protein Iba_chr13bCG4960 [Ipomoea batatas]